MRKELNLSLWRHEDVINALADNLTEEQALPVLEQLAKITEYQYKQTKYGFVFQEMEER